MVREALDVLPGLATVRALEEPRFLDAGVDGSVEAGGKAPDRRDLRAVVAVRHARRGVGPGRSAVIGSPHGRAVPGIAGRGVDRAGPGLDDEVMGRPPFAEWALDRPVFALLVAVEDERALLRTDEQLDLGHGHHL